MHLREYCLQYGASVIFTSASANKNLDCLFQYLLHRMYDWDFLLKSELLERDQFFLPAGKDNKELIETLAQASKIQRADPNGDPILFEDVIQ